MALSEQAVLTVGASMLDDLQNDLGRNGKKGRVERYLSGDHDLPYAPTNATDEFGALRRKSVTNWLPLVVDTFAKGLFVDGYRAAKAADDAAPWRYWQVNGLDARQSIAHRGALTFGVSYVCVLKGDPAPVIRPLAPTRTHALYRDPDDDWPEVALVVDGVTAEGHSLYRLFDDRNVWSLIKEKDGDTLKHAAPPEAHGFSHVPWVRFRSRLDGDACGIVAPLTILQDRINEAVFSMLIALQYASFRQRWATGLAIPTDEDEFLSDGVTANPNFGKPVQPFEAAVNRLWVSDSDTAHFGDFDQTDVTGHLNAYKSAVQSMAAVAQCPPHVLLGDLVNLSADALAAAEASTQRKTAEYETLFGESWEQVLRLAAALDSDESAASDTDAQVKWRDTEARSLANTVDALGKMVTMLGVPSEAAWERIPGVTASDVERWKSMRSDADVFGALVGDLSRQAAPAPESPAA